MTAIEQSLGLWIPQVTGRYLNEDWAPENDGFGAQCWDAAANWSKYLGLPVISTGGPGRWPGWAGNMVDAFPQSAAIAAAYQLIGPDDPGLPGDIAVWGDGYYYYPKTHVAVLVNDLGGQLLCISQNSSASLANNPYPQWTTGPTILQHLPRRGLIGFIRPRTGGLAAQGTITTEEGFLMALTDQQQEDVYWILCTPDGREYLRTQVLKLDTVLTKADGAYMNNMRDAQHAAEAAALDTKLDKNDGGYIVNLVESTRPGTADPGAAADALLKIIPAEIAAQVVAIMGQKMGGQ
jgi:hypothetical protein